MLLRYIFYYLLLLLLNFYAPGGGAISVAFVRPYVCPSIVYMVNNSRTQRPSVPKFGKKVPHLRCDSHTSFKVKRSKVRVRGGRGIPCRPNPAATLLVNIYICEERWFSCIMVDYSQSQSVDLGSFSVITSANYGWRKFSNQSCLFG